MKRLFGAVIVSLLGLTGCPEGPSPSATSLGEGATEGRQRVVYHINGDDPNQQAGALRNIQNHIAAVGAEKLDLRVVLHGKGVSLVLLPEALPEAPRLEHANATQQIRAMIDRLRQQGVRFLVCANTLKVRQVKREQLYKVDRGDIVPSGVAELARLQEQGYTYIKP